MGMEISTTTVENSGCMEVLQKTKNTMTKKPYDPTMPLLGIY
jgi:hypothetical protein